MDQNNLSKYIVTEEKVASFVEAVDNEAFVLADIADVMGIGEEEAIAILLHVMELDPSKFGMTRMVGGKIITYENESGGSGTLTSLMYLNNFRSLLY